MAWRMKWFVPVEAEWAALERFGGGRKSGYEMVRVEADDEWRAQNEALSVIRARKVTLRRPYPLIVSAGHAIPEGSRGCGWGCCVFGKR